MVHFVLKYKKFLIKNILKQNPYILNIGNQILPSFGKLIHTLKRYFCVKKNIFYTIKEFSKRIGTLQLLFFLGCSITIKPSAHYLNDINTLFIEPRSHFVFAKSLLGKQNAVFNNKEYRADCSGTVKAIYDSAGLSLGKSEGAYAIYNYVKKKGKLDRRKPKAGDLVFFYASNRRRLAHVGFVEKVLPDKTIIFIHHIGGLIIRSRMNTKYPNTQINPKDNSRLNHVLRGGFGNGCTAGQLFATFGRLQRTFK